MAAAPPFSTIFWNIWINNQMRPARLTQLLRRFDELIATHAPDAFGLNEVLADAATGRSAVLEHLEQAGYHVFFAPFSPEKNGDMCGSALATRSVPRAVQLHELGPDRSAAWRGHKGHTLKLIHAQLEHAGQPVNVVVNYLAHLVPYNWAAHLGHHKAFRRITSAPELQASTIIGGDFNQFKFMPRLWGAKSLYQHATGTLRHPTWRWFGFMPIIQANYDNIFWTKCGHINLEQFKVLERTPSDHAPLLARFLVTP